MKPLLVVVALGSALAVGAGIALSVGSPDGTPRSESLGAVAPGDSHGDVAEALDEVLARLEVLEGNVTMLSTQVAQAREAASRAPVATAAEATPQEATELRSTIPLDAASIERDFVLRVVEEERQRQEDERAAERRQREQERIEERAERIAAELGLAPADQTRLAKMMTDASAKRSELFTAMREEGFDGDRETVRAAFTELQESYTKELNAAFGETLGAQIAEQANLGGGRRGGFSFGGGGRGGGDAGDGGGGRRRGGGF